MAELETELSEMHSLVHQHEETIEELKQAADDMKREIGAKDQSFAKLNQENLALKDNAEAGQLRAQLKVTEAELSVISMQNAQRCNL